MGKNRKCTACGLSVKGHHGPTGRKCTATEDSFTDQNSPEPQHAGPGTTYEHSTVHNNATSSEDIKQLTALVQGMQMQINKLASQSVSSQSASNTPHISGGLPGISPAIDVSSASGAPSRNIPFGIVNAATAATGVQGGHNRGQVPSNVTPPLAGSSMTGGSYSHDAAWLGPGAAMGIPSTHVGAPSGVNFISDKIALTALRGEYVMLDEFLTQYNFDINDEEYKSVVDSDGNVTVKPKKRKRVINSFARWEEAYTNYERLMVYYGGYEMYDQMVRYRVYIASVNRKYKWQAVAMYDARHRLDLAGRHSCRFAELNSDLANTILDSTAIKLNAPRCPRCSAYDHVEVAECPFPARAAAAASKKPQTLFGGLGATATEICNNFNEGKCKWNEKCRRIHMCIRCKGPHPARECTKTVGASAVTSPS